MRRYSNVRIWLQADIQALEIDVRYTPNNGHSEAHVRYPCILLAYVFGVSNRSSILNGWPLEIIRLSPLRSLTVSFNRIDHRNGRSSLLPNSLGPNFLPAFFSSKPNLLGQFTAPGSIFGSHHRIIRRQSPLLPIFVR